MATILKEFLRDLPEPLLPREVYHPLLSVQSKLWTTFTWTPSNIGEMNLELIALRPHKTPGVND